MSDDAFAMSPIAAQPPQQSEADYQSLIEALTANARGRWFLSEFAKRNRVAETSKMLDAVARIEHAVAARPAVAAATSDFDIARAWALAARAEAAAELQSPEREAATVAAQRGARIIREIAYSMRACGNDPRICNILDTQLDAIETAQQHSDSPQQAVLTAFDRLIAQLDELSPAPSVADAVSVDRALEQMSAVKPAPPADPEERFAAVADLAEACAAGDRKIELSAADFGEDDAVLDRIAFEMAAAIDDEPEPVAATRTAMSELQSVPAPPSEPLQRSLGAALLAQGLVPAQFKLPDDPFAALKRLTQAEKVALFT